MSKSETIHVRINPPLLKKEAEQALNDLGINLSYAISLFLTQVVKKKEIPFKISSESLEVNQKVEELSFALNSTGGQEIDEESKNIIHLYATNQIDYETACFAINRKINKKALK